jgi:hypothetical protein
VSVPKQRKTLSKVTMADPKASCTFWFSRNAVFISPHFDYAQGFRGWLLNIWSRNA